MFSAISVFALMAGASNWDAPADEDILQALPPVARDIPLVIVKNRLGEPKVSPVAFFPFIGPARLVEVRWECVVYYTQIIQSDFPFPAIRTKDRVQVIYMEQAELVK